MKNVFDLMAVCFYIYSRKESFSTSFLNKCIDGNAICGTCSLSYSLTLQEFFSLSIIIAFQVALSFLISV